MTSASASIRGDKNYQQTIYFQALNSARQGTHLRGVCAVGSPVTHVHDVMAMVIQTLLCILLGGMSIGQASLQGSGHFYQT